MTYDDFRQGLRENGYAVVKGVIPQERVAKYQQKALDWICSFGTDLSLDNPDTWTQENLPIATKIRAYGSYSVPHERFMWEARMEPGVLDAFAKIWGTDELVVSFGGLNVGLPNRKDLHNRTPWAHIDQSPHKRGLHCIQGIINLCHSGPDDGGLCVFPRSSKLHDEFWKTHRPTKNLNVEINPENYISDIYMFSQKELEWFAEKGVTVQKVSAEPGDLILWDSRTIHYARDASPSSKTIRLAIYATYMPAKWVTLEQLAVKKKCFEAWGWTMHWPYENIKPGARPAILPDGTRDPKDRSQPLELPELSDKLLKLAGVKVY